MKRLLAVAAVAAALSIVAFMIVGASNAPATVPLSSISATDLASNGLTLTQPAETAKVVQADAASAALVGFPGASVRESVLAQVADSQIPGFNKLAWVVVLDNTPMIGSRGPAGGNLTLAPAYTIVVVDASTGQFLFGVQSGPMP